MHIPDGFLSTGVWATLDVAAVPAVITIARRAQRGFDESKVPLLGVMGAFVFAAQMINFPVGIGTTGHLVGGALLAFTLGPAAATVVMTAIIAIQALVFQDGGILALGANILNMAVLGVLAGYLPYRLWSGTRWRKAAIFAGAALSVMVSATMALAELLLSKVRMPASMIAVSVALFVVSALIEGGITLAVIQALEAIRPGFVTKPTHSGRLGWVSGAIGVCAVFLAGVGVLFAATAPDGIQRLGMQTGLVSHAASFFTTPFSNYETSVFSSPYLRKASAGIAGLFLIYGACVLMFRGSRAHK